MEVHLFAERVSSVVIERYAKEIGIIIKKTRPYPI